MPLRAAIVMEQTLGHVTHYQNLRTIAADQDELVPTWLPISFEPSWAERYLRVVRSNWSARASWRARRALDATLRDRPHDAIVFHTQVTSLFSVGLMRRLPTVISLDATPLNFDAVASAYGHTPAGTGWIDRRKHAMNRAALQAAAGVIAWSEWARRSVIDEYAVQEDRVRVIAPGAAREFFAIGARRSGQDARPASPEQPVRVLFVGGDFMRKGGQLLLEAVRGPLAGRCELHVVTRYTLPAEPNVVVHTGAGPNSPELLQLFAEADIFVLPSNGECLSIALMEAAAAALPVVTTGVGALAEAVLPGETGFVVPPGDLHRLSEALETLIADPALRRRMGTAGLALARRKFDAHQNDLAFFRFVAEAARRSPKAVVARASRRSR